MGRKQKIINDVRIESVAAEGTGLGRVDGKVVFVDYGIPGDVADVRLTRNKKDYALGRIETLKSPSELRIEPFCDHFGVCGGCRWQHISYDQQLEFKHAVVEEAFRRTGGLTDYELRPILGSARSVHYRNKMEFTFSSRGWFTREEIASGAELDRRALGLHVPGQFSKIVHIRKCHIMDERDDAVRTALYDFAARRDLDFFDPFKKEGLLRNLILRCTTTGQRMIVVVFGRRDEAGIAAVMDFLIQTCPETDSIQYVVNTKPNDTIYDLEVIPVYGKPFIEEKLGETVFRIGPKSFFQTNSRQAKVLFDTVSEFAEIGDDDLVYDLYTGIGSIALYLAPLARKVIGVETVPEAIEDAEVNAELNGIRNAEFIAGISEKVLDEAFIGQHGRPDVLITDPPRAGMHRDVVDFILTAAPKRIVYVSCNPVTQARDIRMLSTDYELVKAQPVDMFPHTYHVENVALLRRVD